MMRERDRTWDLEAFGGAGMVIVQYGIYSLQDCLGLVGNAPITENVCLYISQIHTSFIAFSNCQPSAGASVTVCQYLRHCRARCRYWRTKGA
jgi:hypothetical protein